MVGMIFIICILINVISILVILMMISNNLQKIYNRIDRNISFSRQYDILQKIEEIKKILYELYKNRDWK